MPVKAGISTACLYPMLLEDALYEVCSRGGDNIEIFINTHCEVLPDFVKKMKEITMRYGTNVISLHPFTPGIEPMMLFTDYERRFTDMLDYYRLFFEACNVLGAGIFVLHGNKPLNPIPDEMYFDRFFRLHELGKEYGVIVAQENVKRCSAGKLDFMKKMADALGDDASFVLDTKQAIRSGEDIINVVETLGNKIVHIHYSDNSPERDCMKFGAGTFDYNRFFDVLDKVGFDGTAVLELYRCDFEDEQDLVDNFRIMRDAIEKRK